MIERRLLGVLALIAFLTWMPTITGSANSFWFLESSRINHPSMQGDDLSGVNVAILQADTSEVANACRIAMKCMFEWMNASVSLITPAEIKSGDLWNYDILGLPPGNLPSYNVQLGSNGLEAIRSFVAQGGSYFGIAGGAIFACDELIYSSNNDEYMLKLFNGSARGPILGVDDQTINEINVNITNGVIDLSGVPSTLSTLHWGTTFYVPNENIDIVHIASVPGIDRSSMIAYQYDSGCVFLSGFHPEFEENSDRDGSDMFDYLDDDDSEWLLMMRIAKWMVSTSVWNTDTTSSTTVDTISTNTTGTEQGFDPIPLSVIVAAAIGLVVIVIVIKKRT